MDFSQMTPEEANIAAVSVVVAPSDLTPHGFLGIVIAFIVVTTTTVAMRLWSNFNHAGKIFIDDYLCLVALAFLIWNAVTFYFLLALLNSDPLTVRIEQITTLCAVGIFAGNLALYTAKLPLLFLYIRTFGIERWMRWTCKILAVCGVLGFLATATYTSVTCSSHLYAVSPLFLFQCIEGVTNGCISRASMSMTMDVAMFILPLPIIRTLNMPLRRKLGLAMVFMTGLVAIAASALGLYYQKAQTGGSSTNFANALVVTVVESAIVILVSCTPALHLFWTKHAGHLRARLGLTGFGSKGTSSRPADSSRGSRKPKDEYSSSLGVSATNGSIQVTTHHYIELQDVHGSTEPISEARVTAKNSRMNSYSYR